MSEDAIETLVNYMSMMEHLPREGVVSLPLLAHTNWADWSNAVGWEMYLRWALEKLSELKYPLDDDDSPSAGSLRLMVAS
jgi:hypothetical protein